MSKSRYKSFSEFWPFYVAEHSKPATRWLHLLGTTAGLLTVVYFIASGRWWLFPLGFIPGYGCAWLAHFVIEKNKPATFEYPLWSFFADYKMIGLMLTGRMGQQVLATKGTKDPGVAKQVLATKGTKDPGGAKQSIR